MGLQARIAKQKRLEQEKKNGGSELPKVLKAPDVEISKDVPLSIKLEAEKKHRAEQCTAEVNEVMQRWNCKFSPAMIIQDGQIQQMVGIVAL